MEPTHYSCPECGHDNPIANGCICENCMDTYMQGPTKEETSEWKKAK